MTTQGRKLDITCTVRLDPRDYARLLLYWKECNCVFPDKAAMLRHTYQTFLKEHAVVELTTTEADSIRVEETYIRTPRSTAISEITTRLDTNRIEQARRLASLSEIDLDSAINNLPMETEEESKDK